MLIPIIRPGYDFHVFVGIFNSEFQIKFWMIFGIQPYFEFLGFSRPKIEIEKIPGIHPSHGSIFYHLSLRCHLVPCGTLSVASPSRKILAKQTTESFIFVSSDSDSEDWRIWLWKSEEKNLEEWRIKKIKVPFYTRKGWRSSRCSSIHIK